MTPAFTAAGRRYFCTRIDADNGFLPFRRVLGNTKSWSLAYGVFSRQASRKPARRGCIGTGAFEAFDFGSLNRPHTYARLTYITRSSKFRSIHIKPRISDTLKAVAASLKASVRRGSGMLRRISKACCGVMISPDKYWSSFDAPSSLGCLPVAAEGNCISARADRLVLRLENAITYQAAIGFPEYV